MNSAAWLPILVFIEMKFILASFTDRPFELGITGIFFIIKNSFFTQMAFSAEEVEVIRIFPGPLSRFLTCVSFLQVIYLCFAMKQNISTGPYLKMDLKNS